MARKNISVCQIQDFTVKWNQVPSRHLKCIGYNQNIYSINKKWNLSIWSLNSILVFGKQSYNLNTIKMWRRNYLMLINEALVVSFCWQMSPCMLDTFDFAIIMYIRPWFESLLPDDSKKYRMKCSCWSGLNEGADTFFVFFSYFNQKVKSLF